MNLIQVPLLQTFGRLFQNYLRRSNFVVHSHLGSSNLLNWRCGGAEQVAIIESSAGLVSCLPLHRGDTRLAV